MERNCYNLPDLINFVSKNLRVLILSETSNLWLLDEVYIIFFKNQNNIKKF